MFWNKSQTPAQAASTSTRPSSFVSRSDHLSSYLDHSILKPSTRKIPSSSDDAIYDTVFQTTNGFALIARVYVPADIGGRAPSMILHGVRASHQWLDIRMKVIGYAPLSSDQLWRSSNLKLGDAVYAVIHHFQLTPPSVLEITDPSLKRLQETLSGSQTRPKVPKKTSIPPSVSGVPRTDESHGQETPPVHNSIIVDEKPNYEVGDFEVDALIPSVPTSFLEIDNTSLSELKQLVQDDKASERFVRSTSAVETLQELKKQIATSNVETAKANLQAEAKLKESADTVDTLQAGLEAKIQHLRKLEAERAKLIAAPDVREAIEELNTAKQEAYRASEELADDWVESGGQDVGVFVEQFMRVRRLYHARAAKAERLEHCVAL